MVLVDLFCDNCNNILVDQFVDTSLENHGICDKCKKGILKRMVSNKMTFELKYNNKTDICDWDGNSTQLWNKVKETKKEDVKVPEKFRDKWY